MKQRGDADVDGVPERRRPFRLQLRAKNPHELVVVRREVAGIDLDAICEAADARLVGRQHDADKLLGRLFDEIEVRAHAAATVQQHDDRDRLDLVGEQRQLLSSAVVVNLKLIPREIGNQPSG